MSFEQFITSEIKEFLRPHKVWVAYFVDGYQKYEFNVHLIGVYPENDLKKCCLAVLNYLEKNGRIGDKDRYSIMMDHINKYIKGDGNYAHESDIRWCNDYKKIFIDRIWDPMKDQRDPPIENHLVHIKDIVARFDDGYFGQGWSFNIELKTVS